MIIAIFIIWIICGFIASHIARNKNRDPTKWFIIGSLLALLGIIWIGFLPKAESDSSKASFPDKKLYSSRKKGNKVGSAVGRTIPDTIAKWIGLGLKWLVITSGVLLIVGAIIGGITTVIKNRNTSLTSSSHYERDRYVDASPYYSDAALFPSESKCVDGEAKYEDDKVSNKHAIDILTRGRGSCVRVHVLTGHHKGEEGWMSTMWLVEEKP